MTDKTRSSNIRKLQKGQLFPELGFMRFCNVGYIESQRRLNVTGEFLDAAQLDGLIIPLLEETPSELRQEGEPAAAPVSYYSPHQLVMVVALRKNILRDGRLSSEEPLVTMASGVQPYRTVMWSESLGLTVHADSGKPIGSPLGDFYLPTFAKNLHNFLRMVHSYPQVRVYSWRAVQRDRYFSGAPKIEFDFSELKADPAAALLAYGLTVEDLNMLRHMIGSVAAQIDPLEYWHEYISLHPQYRRDKFKGDALLAQELYLTTELVADVVALVTGKPPAPLMELLHGGDQLKPFLVHSKEYASGTDSKALKACAAKVREWLDENTGADLDHAGMIAKLGTAESNLDAFIERYGDRSYISGVPRPVETDDMPLDKLDSDVRKFAEDLLSARDSHEPRNEYDEFFDSQGYRVAEAIRYKLDSLRHELGAVIFGVRDQLIKKSDKSWHALRNAESWGKPEGERQELYKEAEEWKAKRGTFDDASVDFGRVYCGMCRERPAPLHHEHNDNRISDDPICDECFAKVASGALKMSEKDWKDIKGGEWFCDFCVNDKGRPVLLYRFAQRNTVSTIGQTKAPLRVELEYGHMKIEAKCPNCGREQSREMDWGWVD